MMNSTPPAHITLRTPQRSASQPQTGANVPDTTHWMVKPAAMAPMLQPNGSFSNSSTKMAAAKRIPELVIHMSEATATITQE